MIHLQQATAEDALALFELQVAAFSPLLEKYQDYDTNPANETIDRVYARIHHPTSTFLKIVAAVLTTIATSGLLTLVLCVYDFLEDSDEDVFFSAFDFFLIYTIYLFPIIFISGILVDWLKKRFVSILPTRRKTVPLLYGVSGSLIALVILLLLHDGAIRSSELSVLLPFLMLFGLSAILYFWISHKILRKSYSNPKK
ncbi:hypothetical protein [Exiguobacterium antarcticum]|uniref:DUF1129 domain-containing protein n=1 Tax=Exiguobacterium antarcticum TaxID=132920 RepID=A0ABT6R7P9_9BACL|nr:hypothetical protein [Exiguobacterium antarcticum]AFS70509.1 Hypothetical protein Eab7_1386 [Exiguobacterium antarcticum B7]MDI3236324.1 hypothetical protein [Exiguobacterium antarcticum]